MAAAPAVRRRARDLEVRPPGISTDSIPQVRTALRTIQRPY